MRNGKCDEIGVNRAGDERFKAPTDEDVGLQASIGVLGDEAHRVIGSDCHDVIDVGSEG